MVTEQKNEDHIQELQEEQKENNYMGKSRKRNIKYEDTNISKKVSKKRKPLKRRNRRSYSSESSSTHSETEKYTVDTDDSEYGTMEDYITAFLQFVTKKSEKHFVGKVITIKGTTPEVKFVRKVKESKCNSGVVFTYPRVDDICTIRHLDDILLILPDPNISRRGQIVFNNINLSKYNLQ
ncbi:hypothetical protein ACJJTC_017555 [Scirpophaga incertulas]